MQAAVFMTPLVCTLAVGAVFINLSWLYLLAVPVVFLAVGRLIAPMRFWRVRCSLAVLVADLAGSRPCGLWATATRIQ
jgi:hypothetical protein